ncbi:MAG: hypothetical protein ACR2LC_01825 [Pyrinomonadaceae bacterium]
MNLKPKQSKIHYLDRATLIKALIRSLEIESIAILPMSIYGWGHAGPEGGIVGLIGGLLNLPGFIVVMGLTYYLNLDWPSWYAVVAAIYLVQVGLLSYVSPNV